MHTTDSGQTWHEVKVKTNSASANAQTNCQLSDLRRGAPGALTFLAVCSDESSTLTGFLYQTINDGKTWQANPLPDNFIAFPGPLQIFMVNSTNGWAVGCDSPANGTDPTPCESDAAPTFAFYKTVDTGKTWSRIGSMPTALRPVGSSSIGWTFAQFDFIDDHTGWAIDPTGNLFATTDAGLTWTALSPQFGVSPAVPTLTPIPTSAVNTCPKGTPPRLTGGQKAHITLGTPNNLRSVPNANGQLIGTVPGGAEIQVVTGPVCDKQLIWWQITYQGQTGWTPESDGKTYFITPG